MPETKAKKTYYWGTGRRKTSVARVRLSDGKGSIKINDRPLEDFFTETKDRNAVTAPLDLCEVRNKTEVHIRVHGGGITGQAGAIKQGLARALKDMFGGDVKPAATPPGEGAEAPADGADAGPSGMVKKLRDSGFLTRDGRMKERKKYGRKGARRSFQFSKR